MLKKSLELTRLSPSPTPASYKHLLSTAMLQKRLILRAMGRFGPIPFRSGRFGPILEVGRFGPLYLM